MSPVLGTKLPTPLSSYIPTLSAFAPSRERTIVSNNIRLLAVPEPSSDRQTHLSGAYRDRKRRKDDWETHLHIHIRESNGDVEGVPDGTEQSDWVHFACHGVQNSQSPTDSGLCLADKRRLRLPDIIRLSRPRGGFAFLSECETTTGAVELSDEAAHLSAGILFAGYSSVIGTMWSIKDSVAPRLAKDVYEQLFRDGKASDSRGCTTQLNDMEYWCGSLLLLYAIPPLAMIVRALRRAALRIGWDCGARSLAQSGTEKKAQSEAKT